jgi:electron transfer flavoprotein beta subunit
VPLPQPGNLDHALVDRHCARAIPEQYRDQRPTKEKVFVQFLADEEFLQLFEEIRDLRGDSAFESFDELFYASVIAEAVAMQSSPFDLILCGKHNIDLDAGAVGPALAEFLDWPHLGAVTNLEITPDGNRFTARRRIEGASAVACIPRSCRSRPENSG